MPQIDDTFTGVLTEYAQAAYQNPDAFSVGAALFPVVGVGTARGFFDRYDDSAAFTPVDTLLSRDNTAHRITLHKDLGVYDCTAHGLEVGKWDPAMLQADAEKLRMASLKTLMSAQFTSREHEAIAAVKGAVSASSGGNWTSSDADVISELDSLLLKVAAGAAAKPTRILMGRAAWQKAANHASVTSRLQGIALAYNTERLSALLNMDIPVTIVDSFIKTADGLQFMMADDVFVYYNTPGTTEEDMGFGKEFTLSPDGPNMVTWKENGTTDVDTLVWSSDRKIVNPAAFARLEIT